MPFSGPGDSSLPNHVKKLSPNKKAQWVHVFNSSFSRCTKEGGSNCDGAAMKRANGVAASEDFYEALDSGNKKRKARYAVEVKGADAPKSVQLFPTPGIYNHPVVGRLEITRKTNQEIVDNFANQVYQEHTPIDAEHLPGLSGAVGYIKTLALAEDGSVDAEVDWTKRGKSLFEDDAYRYISPEWFLQWEDKTNGEKHKNVLRAAGLTTLPFFKDMRPLVASEGKLFDLDGDKRIEVTLASDELEEMILSNALDSFEDLADGVLTEVGDGYAIITTTKDGDDANWKVDFEYDEEADEVEFTGDPVGVQPYTAYRAKEETHKKRISAKGKNRKERRRNLSITKAEDVVKAAEELEEEEQEGLFMKLAKKLGIKITAKEEDEEKEKKEKEEKEQKEIIAKEEEEKEKKEKEEKEKEEMTATEKDLTEQLAKANETIKASDEKIKTSGERIAVIENATQKARFRDIILAKDEEGTIKAKEASKTLHPFVGEHDEAMTMLATIAGAHGEDSKEFAAYVARERGHADAIHEAGTFQEAGRVGDGGVIAGSSKEEFENLVTAAIAKDKDLKEGDAIRLVANEHPELYEKQDKEGSGRKHSYPKRSE